MVGSFLKILGFSFLLCHLAIDGFATHLRAAEITVEHINCSTLTFRITITAYLNTLSFTQFGGYSLADGHLDFGDGTVQLIPVVPATPRPDLGPNIGMASYTVDHTFPVVGTYKINYYERDRSEGVLNIPGSFDVPFSTYFELHIKSSGCDQYPRLSIPPVDRTCPGVAFFHNPGAYDPDGDSLSYALTVPSYDATRFVDGYRDPNDPSFYLNYATGKEDGDGPPEFFIDPLTGLITWNAPGQQGEYNIAFKIIEWKKNPVTEEYEVMSVTVRDMQIIVVDCNNERPDLLTPQDTCIEAGTILHKKIKGVDPESDMVKMEAFSEVFDLPDERIPATVTPYPATFRPSDPAATLDFDWTTDCLHVREQPYQVVFKITDDPPAGTRLVTYKTWNIRVIAPAPKWKNMELDLIKRSARLEWEPYGCTNAEKIQLWRKVGPVGYTPGVCSPGLPGFLGYEMMAELNSGQSSYLDTNNGKGLEVGATYCYRLLAVFGLPQGGKSYVSKEVCVGPILIDAPLITRVSVERTHYESGIIQVGWWSPIEINKAQFPGPYEYEVYRAEGFAGESSLVNISGRISDTTFVDRGINTEEKAYNYRIVLYSNTENDENYYPIDTSAVASSVRLSGTSGTGRIILDWEAAVPWSSFALENTRHLIYRGEGEEDEENLLLIDSVDVTSKGLHYVDNTTEPDKEYCYRIVTRGSYGNAKIGLLENASQTACLYPENGLLPCPPQVSAVGLNCEEFLQSETCNVTVFSNTIYWTGSAPEGCRNDIRSYNLYAANSMMGDYQPIATQLRDTFFIEDGLASLARCYKVEAVDALGRVSAMSEAACSDNCPFYELPNVFTPNGDACNDKFSAYYDPRAGGGDEINCPIGNVTRCPRFVNRVDFKVFNQWGAEVYTYNSGTGGSVYIEWDGRDNNGSALESAVYYYIANIDFNVLDPGKRTEKLKGWVHLIR
jgi:CHU_C Type IX secretion signal domain